MEERPELYKDTSPASSNIDQASKAKWTIKCEESILAVFSIIYED